jgi:hypothetical protein
MGYSTDLTDKQWSLIESIFKSNKGRDLAKHSKRELVNGVDKPRTFCIEGVREFAFRRGKQGGLEGVYSHK